VFAQALIMLQYIDAYVKEPTFFIEWVEKTVW